MEEIHKLAKELKIDPGLSDFNDEPLVEVTAKLKAQTESLKRTKEQRLKYLEELTQKVNFFVSAVMFISEKTLILSSALSLYLIIIDTYSYSQAYTKNPSMFAVEDNPFYVYIYCKSFFAIFRSKLFANVWVPSRSA